jgi:hypothetical protein
MAQTAVAFGDDAGLALRLREAGTGSTGTALEGLVRLSRAAGGMLASLLERGWGFPFRFVALAQNGACMKGRVVREEGLEPVWEVEDIPDEGLQLPIHLLWLDSEGGDAAHVRVDTSGATSFLS